MQIAFATIIMAQIQRIGFDDITWPPQQGQHVSPGEHAGGRLGFWFGESFVLGCCHWACAVVARVSSEKYKHDGQLFTQQSRTTSWVRVAGVTPLCNVECRKYAHLAGGTGGVDSGCIGLELVVFLHWCSSWLCCLQRWFWIRHPSNTDNFWPDHCNGCLRLTYVCGNWLSKTSRLAEHVNMSPC